MRLDYCLKYPTLALIIHLCMLCSDYSVSVVQFIPTSDGSLIWVKTSDDSEEEGTEIPDLHSDMINVPGFFTDSDEGDRKILDLHSAMMSVPGFFTELDEEDTKLLDLHSATMSVPDLFTDSEEEDTKILDEHSDMMSVPGFFTEEALHLSNP